MILTSKNHHGGLWYMHSTLFWALGAFRIFFLQEVGAVPTGVGAVTVWARIKVAPAFGTPMSIGHLPSIGHGVARYLR